MERKYITGMGVISCQGCIDEFWDNLNNTDKQSMNDYNLPVDIPQIISNNVARRIDRFSKLTLISSMLALKDSSLNGQEYDPYRVGTVFNTGYGPINSNISFASKLISDGVDMVSPTVFAATVSNAGLGHTCINLKLKGASTMLGGSNCIGCACDLLDQGKADALLVGGIDEYCNDLQECFNQKDYISKNEQFICTPMDVNRDGTRMSEAAAVMVLEKENAPFFNWDKAVCEVRGYGNAISYDNPGIATQPINNEAFINSMTAALTDAQINSNQIDGIFMAANGGRYGDQAEADAIHTVFGEKAASIPVTAIKGAIGETMGSSFSINTIAAAMSLKTGMMPPAIGCKEPDKKMGLNIVYKKTLKHNFRYVMVNGYDVSNCVYSLILGSK